MEGDDESVKIAAEALQGLSTSEPSTYNGFMSSAMKAYENSKSFSPRFKYGAEIVEGYAKEIEKRYSSPKAKFSTAIVGAGLAFSNESLKSLRYTLQFLRYTNDILSTCIISLKNLIEDPNNAEFSTKITTIKLQVVDLLKKAIDVVSRYTGAALPEPARAKVKHYMLSFPARWTAENSKTEASEVEEANRVLALAQDSLGMLMNVTESINETLDSAEDWCEMFGKKISTDGLDDQEVVVTNLTSATPLG